MNDLLERARSALVLLDIEGAEDKLLDPIAVPALTRSDIIVELHEHKAPGSTYRILQRFSHTHKIDAIAAMPDEKKLAVLDEKSRPKDISILREGRRLPQLWLRMRAYRSEADVRAKC
ncbi:hypothetical protein UNPF46_23950 [Bradyrhizobium sp. UNPF46]|nr:hypothetical protein UNPF46_23950 [Bradyrhizobium sp. UNPF46]